MLKLGVLSLWEDPDRPSPEQGTLRAEPRCLEMKEGGDTNPNPCHPESKAASHSNCILTSCIPHPVQLWL